MEKHPHIIVFMFGSKKHKFGEVWTSLDKFGRKKSEMNKKSLEKQKILDFCLVLLQVPKCFGLVQTFCARQKDDLHSVKLVFVAAQKFLKRQKILSKFWAGSKNLEWHKTFWDL